MSWQDTVLSYNLKRKLNKKNKLKGQDPKNRPTSHIMRKLIFLCLILFIIGILIGFFFGDFIYSILKSKTLNSMREKDPIWVPILIFSVVLLEFFWGNIIIFGAITANLMKSKVIGFIERSKIISFYDSDDGDVYYINSVVNYDVKGFKYQNEGLHNFSTTDIEKAKQKLNTLSPGDKILILYDPKNPDLMNLEKNDIDIKGEMLAGIGFYIGGFLFSVFIGTIFS